MDLSNKLWANNAFWLRLSVIAAFVWLVVVASVCLVVYFSLEHYRQGSGIFVLEFSALAFIVPAALFFGLVNSIPLIAQWLATPINSEENEAPHEEFSDSNGSYRNMAERLEIEEDT